MFLFRIQKCASYQMFIFELLQPIKNSKSKSIILWLFDCIWCVTALKFTEMKILSSFPHPHVFSDLYDFCGTQKEMFRWTSELLSSRKWQWMGTNFFKESIKALLHFKITFNHSWYAILWQLRNIASNLSYECRQYSQFHSAG